MNSATIRSVRPTLRWLVLATAALATIGCDRVTKHAATVLLAGEPDRSYFGDTIRLGYAENTVGFLSLGADLPRRPRTAVFTVATGFALLALVVFAVRERFTGPSAVGLVLFVAGGASNWLDRVLRGSVVDFLNVGIGHSGPVCSTPRTSPSSTARGFWPLGHFARSNGRTHGRMGHRELGGTPASQAAPESSLRDLSGGIRRTVGAKVTLIHFVLGAASGQPTRRMWR